MNCLVTSTQRQENGKTVSKWTYEFESDCRNEMQTKGNVFRKQAFSTKGMSLPFRLFFYQIIISLGLFSTSMRDLSNVANDSPKWIVLDGDIDPMWIESLNTVMDDNKVLTLASNERIPLSPPMRLLFEIGHLKTATPATVSRAGILFLNYADVGWNP